MVQQHYLNIIETHSSLILLLLFLHFYYILFYEVCSCWNVTGESKGFAVSEVVKLY